jgi:hypothetical protein
MKKILIESCSDCPDVNACNHIFLDCPLPDEPEKMKGIICIENYQESYDVPTAYYWWIDLGDTNIGSRKGYDTEEEARQDAMEWAEKLGVEVEG